MKALNKYKEAVQELSNLDLGSFVIPKEGNAHEVEGREAHYHYVCIKSHDNRDKTAKIHTAVLQLLSISDYHKQTKQIKDGTFKSFFAGLYNKIVMLHDPTMKPKAETKEETKGLSPTQKSKVKTMLGEGHTTKDISLELDIELERIEAYTSTL